VGGFRVRDHTLKVWDLATSRELRTLKGHTGYVADVGVTADGKRVVSGSDDHTVRVWDLQTGLLVVTFQCDGDATCCAFADERLIIAGDAAGRVYTLSLEE
jgi:WD40 repeat protein